MPWRFIGTVLALLLVWPRVGHVVIPVVDESAIVQHILIAANTLKSTLVQADQYRQAVLSYVQDAKSFVAIPMSYVDEVTGLYAKYNNLLQEGKGISYTLSNAVSQFEQLYTTGFNGTGSIPQRALALAQQVRNAGQAAAAATAVFDRLCAQQATVATLITASQVAPGSLAATQATNQLLSVLSDQQGALQTITATTARVQIGFMMRETTTEERAQWEGQAWMQDWPTETMRPPGQGKGFALP